VSASLYPNFRSWVSGARYRFHGSINQLNPCLNHPSEWLFPGWGTARSTREPNHHKKFLGNASNSGHLLGWGPPRPGLWLAHKVPHFPGRSLLFLHLGTGQGGWAQGPRSAPFPLNHLVALSTFSRHLWVTPLNFPGHLPPGVSHLFQGGPWRWVGWP